MTNFEKLKQKISLEDMVKIIDGEAVHRACDCCAYKKSGFSGCEVEDCEYGIKVWLEREETI